MKRILNIVLIIIIGLLASWIVNELLPSVRILVVLIVVGTLVAITIATHPSKAN